MTQLAIPNSNELIQAVENGNYSAVESLVNSSNIDQREETWSQRTSLHICCNHPGNLPIVQLLVKKGADINATDKTNWTPLHYAANCGDIEVISFLLKKGADPSLKAEDGSTPLFYLVKSKAIELPKQQFQKVADSLISHQSVDINYQTHRGETILHALCISNKCSDHHITFFLKRGALPNIRDKKGKTPFHYAIIHGRMDLLQILIDSGADIRLDISMKGGMMTCEQMAQQYHGADSQLVSFISRERDKLYQAATTGDILTIRNLLYRNSVDVNTRDIDPMGKTPLHIATSVIGNIKVVQYLVKEGADINARDNTNWTPLHYASNEGDLDVVKYLLEKGADPLAEAEDGSLAIHKFVKNKADIFRMKDIVQEMINKGVRINHSTKRGETPLHALCLSPKSVPALLRYFLSHGADPNQLDKKGYSPLHYTVMNRRSDLLPIFLFEFQNSNLDLKSRDGKSVIDLCEDFPEQICLDIMSDAYIKVIEYRTMNFDLGMEES